MQLLIVSLGRNSGLIFEVFDTNFILTSVQRGVFLETLAVRRAARINVALPPENRGE